MEYMKEITITNKKGIHTRVAAAVAYKANQINQKYGVGLFVQRKGKEANIPLASMIALTSLAIKGGEEIILQCQGDEKANQALEEMSEYLQGEISNKNTNIDGVDEILEQNTITGEKMIESITNGVVVVDKNNTVILFNRAAENITGIPRYKVIGKKANEILENSQLHIVLKTGEQMVEAKQRVENTTIITNRSPIIVDNKVIGAIAVFQDITEVERLSNQLESVKEIKERFGTILEYANDGICMVNEKGIITYVNPEYERIWNVKKDECIGKNIEETFSEIDIDKALKTREKQLAITTQRDDGVKIISNITPILINNSFKGVISISKEITELQKMINKLNMAEEKIKYFQEELIRKQDIHEAFDAIIGRNGALKDMLSIASKAAKTSVTVLVRGESGTGKELVAKAIWQASGRKNKPFIRVNCAAIPENLLESELFGHEKGAFTGAIKRKIGRFELANKGTMFLDEIGDISKNLQSKLLRVLQEKEFERVGGIETIKVDVRVIAATNRNLEKMVEEGSFREDLYYRLNVIPVNLPPLRDRKGDIPHLVEYFLKKICEAEDIKHKKIPPSILQYFESYSWPGNIRELENVIKRVIVLSDGDILDESCLPDYLIPEDRTSQSNDSSLITGELATMEDYEREIIKLALEKHKSFNKTGKALGLSHRTVALKARKYGLAD